MFLSDGPDNVSVSISPGHILPNGTVIVYQGSSVFFNCSSSSYPSQRLNWAFAGPSSTNGSLASGSGAWLNFRIEDVQPSAQGVYSCTANNSVSYQAANRSSQLLVYCKYQEREAPGWDICRTSLYHARFVFPLV